MNQPRPPLLLCAGTDRTAAARIAATTVALLAPRPAAVLASPAAAEAVSAAAGVLTAAGFDVTERVAENGCDPSRVAAQIDAVLVVAGASDDVSALARRPRRALLLVPPGSDAPAGDAPALFAYDASPAADDALHAAAELLLPRPAIVATVWHTVAAAVGAALVAVPDDVARRGAEGIDAAAQHDAEAHAAAGAARLGRPAETVALSTGRTVWSALVDAGIERDAAVVVTGTRGRSRLAAALLGSTAEGIVRHAGRPVLLVPPAGER